MFQEIFQDLGLSTNESKVYEALINYGGSGVSTIALRAQIHRSNAYDTLYRLIKKGLVYEVFGSKETVYEPVDPTKLSEKLKEKESRLNKVMPELLSIFTQNRSQEGAYIYKGPEGVKNYLKEALKQGQDIYSFAAKGAWFDPKLKTFTDWFLSEAEKKQIGYHHIFDHVVKKENAKFIRNLGEKVKFLPEKFNTNSTIDIFGDTVVTYTGLNLCRLEDDVTIHVLTSARLADSYRQWWQLIWELLP